MIYIICMNKVVLVLILFLVLGAKDVFASGFHLSSIGEVPTNGIQGGKWWYTASKPTFRGAALPSAPINITIDSTTLQVNTDSSGDWVFTPVADLADGDHQVTLENSGAKINFTLVIGANNVDWDAVGKGGGETLPTVGTYWPTVLLLGMGIGLAGWGGRMWSANKNS